MQATQYVGKGKIDIKHSQLGVWPSPRGARRLWLY